MVSKETSLSLRIKVENSLLTQCELFTLSNRELRQTTKKKGKKDHAWAKNGGKCSENGSLTEKAITGVTGVTKCLDSGLKDKSFRSARN